MATTAKLTVKADGSFDGTLAILNVTAPIAIVPNGRKANDSKPVRCFRFGVLHRHPARLRPAPLSSNARGSSMAPGAAKAPLAWSTTPN
jgi:hypothetical protein